MYTLLSCSSCCVLDMSVTFEGMLISPEDAWMQTALKILVNSHKVEIGICNPDFKC